MFFSLATVTSADSHVESRLLSRSEEGMTSVVEDSAALLVGPTIGVDEVSVEERKPPPKRGGEGGKGGEGGEGGKGETRGKGGEGGGDGKCKVDGQPCKKESDCCSKRCIKGACEIAKPKPITLPKIAASAAFAPLL